METRPASSSSTRTGEGLECASGSRLPSKTANSASMISARASGEPVKAARALLGWSQSDLARHSGISEPTIARLESIDGELGGRGGFSGRSGRSSCRRGPPARPRRASPTITVAGRPRHRHDDPGVRAGGSDQLALAIKAKEPAPKGSQTSSESSALQLCRTYGTAMSYNEKENTLCPLQEQ